MYRTFYEAETPKAEGIPQTVQAVTGLFDSINRRRQQQAQAKQNAMAQYKADAYEGKFTSDQKQLNYLAEDITKQAVNEMMSSPSGSTSPQLRQKQARTLGYKNQSVTNYQQFQDTEQRISQTKFMTGGKNYYNSQYDADRLLKAGYGEEGENPDDITAWASNPKFNRGERINKVSQSIGTNMIQSFDKEGYLSDYVEGMKTQARETKNKSTSGIETTNKIDAVFLNKDGVPQVTDEHAINYLSSSPYVTARYQQELDRELLSEANKMMAEPSGAYLKNLSNEQIISGMRSAPDDPNYIKNTINSVAPGARERNLAKVDLEKKQRQNLTNSYDAGQYDPDAGRGITSKYFTVAPSFDRTNFGGSGGKLTSKSGEKTGMMISLRGQAYDKNDGRMTGNDRSSRDAVIKSYNLAPVLNGVPVDLKAETTDEYIRKINEIPLDQIKNMNLETVIHGQAFNKPEILSNARVQRDKLEVMPNKTEEDKGKLEALNKVLDMASMNPDLEPEVIQSALRTVLGTVVEDLVKVVKPLDPETIDIQNKLGRYNITDRKNWSSDDKAISDAFENRKKEGNDQAYKIAKQAVNDKQPAAKSTTIPTVSSDDDYNKLPAGAVFTTRDGKQYKKPGSTKKKKFLDKDGDGVPDSKLDD